jgi:hypothetical protein
MIKQNSLNNKKRNLVVLLGWAFLFTYIFDFKKIY